MKINKIKQKENIENFKKEKLKKKYFSFIKNVKYYEQIIEQKAEKNL